MINIIIVDDHALFRLGMKGALSGKDSGICVVGEADCGKALFDLLKTTKADIILLDVVLPDMDGIEIARRLRKEYPGIKILTVSSENTEDVVQALMNVGINGFISKRQCSTNQPVEAIYSIMNGLEYFGNDIASIIYNIYVSKKKTAVVSAEFTEREREIISLCREGITSKMIAERINISVRTVDAHKNNIFKKLGINNTVDMIQYAIKNGVIKL